MGVINFDGRKGENRDTIKGPKVALFGPTIAGIGDAIFWFTLLPLWRDLLIVCQSGNLLGPILFFAALPAYLFLRVGWTHVGYSVGVKGYR